MQNLKQIRCVFFGLATCLGIALMQKIGADVLGTSSELLLLTTYAGSFVLFALTLQSSKAEQRFLSAEKLAQFTFSLACVGASVFIVCIVRRIMEHVSGTPFTPISPNWFHAVFLSLSIQMFNWRMTTDTHQRQIVLGNILGASTLSLTQL